MRTLFDTSVAIAFRDGLPHVLSRAEPIEPVALLSILTVVELEGGAAMPSSGARSRRAALDEMLNLLDVVPFGMAEAQIYGRIVAMLGFSRAKNLDRMIAAQAIAAGAAVATLNPRDFRDIPGLSLEDWSA